MNSSFQSYTPRSKPLDYDALLSQEGCEPESGSDFFDVLAFETICISGHDPENYLFAQPDTVSYFYGPDVTGTATKPFLTRWAAWVGNSGIQIGKHGLVTPPASTLGSLSGLYPATRPAKLSGAFNYLGLLVMAIQKNEESIELRRYTDTSGTIETKTFSGSSALLWNSALLLAREPQSAGLVCYYLRQERPRVIFARFEIEAFDVEHIVMPDLRTPPARLITSYAYGSRHFLLFADTLGRDVTLKTKDYSALLRENAGASVSFLSGAIFTQGVPLPDEIEEKGTLAIALQSGLVFDSIEEPANQPALEKATASIAFLEGEVDQP